MTLIAFALLVFAASLASYGLRVALAARSHRGLVIFGFSVGTALLLTAAFIVVVSTNPWLKGRFSDYLALPDEIPNHERPNASLVRSDALRESTAKQTGSDEAVAEHASAPAKARRAYMMSDRVGEDSLASPGESGEAPVVTSGLIRDAERTHLGSIARAVPTMRPTGPWDATTCVVAIQPDPAEPTRWWLENECGRAVVILFSARESESWKYLASAMLLPAKHERFTTQAEETQHGKEIRYVACTVATQHLAELIIAGRRSRSERAWLDELAAARDTDECLARVERWADSGRHSGLPIDQMLGPGLPGRIRVAQ
jgi:hypothetical protein